MLAGEVFVLIRMSDGGGPKVNECSLQGLKWLNRPALRGFHKVLPLRQTSGKR